ncbi:hypothetical protein [Streptomyces boninensis]|uniref:hypothetical protein n=1 Tax=Streptomyces boninensis TaxID=2039455 RepID=UPI003B211D3A
MGDALSELDDIIGQALDNALEGLKNFLKEHAAFFKMFGDILGMMSLVTGLLAFIPILAPILGPVSLILGGLAAVSHYAMAVGTTGSFTAALTDKTFLTSAAGAAFGGGALAAGKALKLAVGPGAPGLFKAVATGQAGGQTAAAFSARSLQFAGNVWANTTALAPGGGAQNFLDIGKAAVEGGKAIIPGGEDGDPKMPAFLDGEAARDSVQKDMEAYGRK